MAYKILLVEDNIQIQEVISDYFIGKSNGELELTLASDGNEGLSELYETEYDLILLDIMLPGIDGFKICREIRQKSAVPIIFITAKVHEEDMLYGYDLGCDDYITKPFKISELYAKANALLKRSKGLIIGKILTCGDITLNTSTYVVKVKEEAITLAPKEFALLKYFLEHKESAVDRETLISRIWGYDYEGNDRVVDNHIKKLRKALKNSGKHIKTVVARGYKMTEKI